jgi:hypothetical protein
MAAAAAAADYVFNARATFKKEISQLKERVRVLLQKFHEMGKAKAKKRQDQEKPLIKVEVALNQIKDNGKPVTEERSMSMKDLRNIEKALLSYIIDLPRRFPVPKTIKIDAEGRKVPKKKPESFYTFREDIFEWLNPDHYMKNGDTTVADFIKQMGLGEKFLDYPVSLPVSNSVPSKLLTMIKALHVKETPCVSVSLSKGKIAIKTKAGDAVDSEGKKIRVSRYDEKPHEYFTEDLLGILNDRNIWVQKPGDKEYSFGISNDNARRYFGDANVAVHMDKDQIRGIIERIPVIERIPYIKGHLAFTTALRGTRTYLKDAGISDDDIKNLKEEQNNYRDSYLSNSKSLVETIVNFMNVHYSGKVKEVKKKKARSIVVPS